MPRPDDILELTVAELQAVVRKATRKGYRKGEATAVSFLKSVSKLNGSAAPLLKGHRTETGHHRDRGRFANADPLPETPAPEPDVDPHAALWEAALEAVAEAKEAGDEDAVAGLVDAYRAHLDDPGLMTGAMAPRGLTKSVGLCWLRKAEWDESKHDRADDGKFGSGGGGGAADLRADSAGADDDAEWTDDVQNTVDKWSEEDDKRSDKWDAASDKLDKKHEKEQGEHKKKVEKHAAAVAKKEPAREKEDAKREKARDKEDRQLEAKRDAEDAAADALPDARDEEDAATEAARGKEDEEREGRQQIEYDNAEQAGEDTDPIVARHDAENKEVEAKRATEDKARDEARAAEDAEIAGREAVREKEDDALAASREKEDDDLQAARDREDAVHDAEAEAHDAAEAEMDARHQTERDAHDDAREAHDRAVYHERREKVGGYAHRHAHYSEDDHKRYGGEAIHKAWDESKHPRGKHGYFISRDAIQAAAVDPVKADKLRAEVKPGDEGKLEAALADPAGTVGHTKRGQQRHEAGQRRQKRRADHARAQELADKVSTGGASYAELQELGDHLEGLTADALRSLQSRIPTHGNGRRKAEMVAALRASLDEHRHAIHGRELGADEGKLAVVREAVESLIRDGATDEDIMGMPFARGPGRESVAGVLGEVRGETAAPATVGESPAVPEPEPMPAVAETPSTAAAPSADTLRAAVEGTDWNVVSSGDTDGEFVVRRKDGRTVEAKPVPGGYTVTIYQRDVSRPRGVNALNMEPTSAATHTGHRIIRGPGGNATLTPEQTAGLLASYPKDNPAPAEPERPAPPVAAEMPAPPPSQPKPFLDGLRDRKGRAEVEKLRAALAKHGLGEEHAQKVHELSHDNAGTRQQAMERAARYVATTVAAGKPVPDEVLRDYPDLAPAGGVGLPALPDDPSRELPEIDAGPSGLPELPDPGEVRQEIPELEAMAAPKPAGKPRATKPVKADPAAAVKAGRVPFAADRNPAWMRDIDHITDRTTAGVPLRPVPLDGLIATQEKVNPKKVGRFKDAAPVRAEGEEDIPVAIVIGEDGKRYISEGHHRAAAALLRGDTTVPAIVLRHNPGGTPRFVPVDPMADADPAAPPPAAPASPAPEPKGTAKPPAWVAADPQHAAAADAYAGATGEARRVMEASLVNAGWLATDDDGSPTGWEPDSPGPAARERAAARLAAGHRGLTDPGDREHVGRALAALGAVPIGAAGETVPFAGLDHEAATGVSTGAPVRVAEPGWAMPGPGGRVVLLPAKVEPAGAKAGATPAAKPKAARTHSGAEIAAAYNAGTASTAAGANPLIRAAAGLSRAEAADALRAMGKVPVSSLDPRRQIAETIFDRAGANIRSTLGDRGEAGATARGALGDEAVVSPDEVFGPRAKSPGARPASAPTQPAPAPKPARPAAEPPATPEGRAVADLYARASSADQAEIDGAGVRLAALPAADLARVAAAMNYTPTAKDKASKAALAAALHARIRDRQGASIRSQLGDRPAAQEPTMPAAPKPPA